MMQLLHTFHEFATVVDDGQVGAIFLNLAKAFGSLSRHKLLHKLNQVLENDCLLQWINSYLRDCQRYVGR